MKNIILACIFAIIATPIFAQCSNGSCGYARSSFVTRSVKSIRPNRNFIRKIRERRNTAYGSQSCQSCNSVSKSMNCENGQCRINNLDHSHVNCHGNHCHFFNKNGEPCCVMLIIEKCCPCCKCGPECKVCNPGCLKDCCPENCKVECQGDNCKK